MRTQMSMVEFQLGEITVSTDQARLDVPLIHAFLARSYWSPDIPREIVERSIRNSLCFGVFENSQQVGFARVITDRTTFCVSRRCVHPRIASRTRALEVLDGAS
jgi:hypothetical protein